VRLCIEGVPVHAWSEEVAAKVIGPHCAIHYVEGYSRRRDRTRTFNLWAWSFDPSKIAKQVILSITHPDSDFNERQRGRKGKYDYKLHLHLDILEDLSFQDGRGGGNGRKPRHGFLWNYRRPDSLGERRSGQHHDDYTARDYRPRRDRDDDYDDNLNRGVRRHRSQSSWGRMTRCRGAVDDCYSVNTRRQGDNYHHGGHRSRTATWRPKKHVSFANPLVTYMGELHPTTDPSVQLFFPLQSSTTAEPDWFDPMGDESLLMPHLSAGYQSKEQRILSMLEGATGWLPIQSPRGDDDLMGKVMEQSCPEPRQVCTLESVTPELNFVLSLNTHTNQLPPPNTDIYNTLQRTLENKTAPHPLPSAVVTTYGLNVDPLDNSVELQHANPDREDNEALLNNKEILLPKDRANPNGRLHISEETPINVSICIDTDQHSLATVAENNGE
jgi:hypothetical protein